MENGNFRIKEWREDVYRSDGTLVQKDVLHVMVGVAVDFVTPVWADEENLRQDAIDLLKEQVKRTVNELT